MPTSRPAQVVGELTDRGLRPDQLVLMLSEETLLTSSGNLVASLGSMHAAGVRLCLADYGLGHTMIAHRAMLPFDLVRVDLQGLGSIDPHHVATAARSSVAAADAFGMATLLTGAATGELYALACDLDVAGVAGPVVGTPVSAARLPALLGLRGTDRDLPELPELAGWTP